MNTIHFHQIRFLFLLLLALSTGITPSSAQPQGGFVLAWGDNGYGQTDVPADATNIFAISAGYRHSMALRADGTVIGWGQLGAPGDATNIVAIAAGYFYYMA